MNTVSDPADRRALERSVVLGEPAVYDPYTGEELAAVGTPRAYLAAQLGLEAPRYCRLCGRRMVVQVNPVGWTARCSRHGELTSDAGSHR